MKCKFGLLPLLPLFSKMKAGDHCGVLRSHRIHQNTKKLDCPAQIIVPEVVMYPTFKVGSPFSDAK